MFLNHLNEPVDNQTGKIVFEVSLILTAQSPSIAFNPTLSLLSGYITNWTKLQNDKPAGVTSQETVTIALQSTKLGLGLMSNNVF
jgi:hypothetical protein